MKDIKAEDCKNNFTPVKVEFVIETEEELIELWHRLNCQSEDLNNYYKKSSFKKVGASLYGLWNVIDDICDEKNIDLCDHY